MVGFFGGLVGGFVGGVFFGDSCSVDFFLGSLFGFFLLLLFDCGFAILLLFVCGFLSKV